MINAKDLNKKSKRIGFLGEKIAADFLIKNRSIILKINERVGFDEIDIIAISPEETLLFVEVKTIAIKNENSLFMPEDHLNDFKFKKIARACQKFSIAHPELINEERGWRIDLIAITVREKNNETEEIEVVSLRYYENI